MLDEGGGGWRRLPEMGCGNAAGKQGDWPIPQPRFMSEQFGFRIVAFYSLPSPSSNNGRIFCDISCDL